MSTVATRKKSSGIRWTQRDTDTLSDEPRELWRKLSNNIRDILAQNLAHLTFNENYRYGYELVLMRQSEMLYEGVKALIADNLQKMVKEKLIPAFPAGVRSDMISRAKEGEELLEAFRCVWDDHNSAMCKLRGILGYLDKVYAQKQRLPVIYDAGVLLFRKHIIESPTEGHLIAAVLDEVRVERGGFTINQSAVRGCVQILCLLRKDGWPQSVYFEKLAPPLLEETRRFYEDEGKRTLESSSVPEYLAHVDKRFTEEILRAQRHLTSQITPQLQVVLEDTLLTPHLTTLIYMPNSGMDIMVDTDKIQSLNLMYTLFKRVERGIPALREAFKGSIVRRGDEINVNAKFDAAEEPEGGECSSTGKGKAKQKDVLDLKDKFNRVWSEAFGSDRKLETGMVEGFEIFINANPKAPEFISLFIDENLKKGVKDKTDLEVDIALDETIAVFRYLTDKDVFERYYKNHLAKRLLLGRSVSDDAERQMLSKLRLECGHQFTQKLEGMFHDMKLSAETMEGYRVLERTMAPSVSINVTVMTSAYWPPFATAPCTLPDVLVKATRSFEAYYLAKHTNRKLTWQPSMGTAEVRVQFKARKHDLTVSTAALVILLLFEDLKGDGFLTYEDIVAATSIPAGELARNLQSLACAKYKILKKHPLGRDVNPGDSFSFNDDFTSNLHKIKIGTVSLKVESIEERRETHHRIDEERRHRAEACIVRVMKDRKHMAHEDLINEVTRQLIPRFRPNPIDIKKQIASLIEREYLERSEDRNSYRYLA